MKKIRHALTVFTVLVVFSSCLNRQFIDGWVDIVSSSNIMLNDSSLVFGHVYRVDRFGDYYFENEFEIWIENSDLKTTNDSTGKYSIKTLPGTYTIKCKSKGNEWVRLIEEVQNIDLVKNKKTEINFYIGYTIE